MCRYNECIFMRGTPKVCSIPGKGWGRGAAGWRRDWIGVWAMEDDDVIKGDMGDGEEVSMHAVVVGLGSGVGPRYCS